MVEHPRRQRCRRNGRVRVRVPLCPPSRLHAQSHDLITRVKPYVSEKTWVFRHLRPSFIGSSVLSGTVQRRTMLYKTRYEYRYIYRGPMFSIQSGQVCQAWETGHSKSIVSRVRFPSHPLRWHNGVSSLPPRVREIHSWQFFSPSRSTPSRTA